MGKSNAQGGSRGQSSSIVCGHISRSCVSPKYQPDIVCFKFSNHACANEAAMTDLGPEGRRSAAGNYSNLFASTSLIKNRYDNCEG